MATKTVLKQCALVAGAFIALDAIYALTAGPISYQGQGLVEHIPLKDQLIDQWREGTFPTWTSSVGAGQPLFADSASHPLDPRNLLLLPFSTVNGYILAGIATRAFAATIMFAYLRLRPGISAWPSFLGTLVFLSSTSLIEEGTGFGAGALLLPAFIWLSELLCEALTLRRLLALAGAWAVFMVTSSAAYAPYFVVGSIAWCLLYARFRDRRFNRIEAIRFLVGFGAAGAIGLALAAFVVLPTLEFGSISNRGNEYATDPFALHSLLSLFFGANRASAVFPAGAYYFYIGIISFAPILVALRRWANPYVRAGLALGAGTALLLLTGSVGKPVLVDIVPTLASVPLFRPALLIGFGAAVLVAVGLDEREWRLAPPARLGLQALFLLQASVLIALAVLAAILTTMRLEDEAAYRTLHDPLIALSPGILALLLVGVRALGLGSALVKPAEGSELKLGSLRLQRAALVGALLGVELALAWGIARPMTGNPYRSTPEVRYLQGYTGPDLRALEILPKPGWRTSALPGATESFSLVQNAPAYQGIPTANVYASLIPEAYSDTFKDFGDFSFRKSVFARAPNAYMTTSKYDSPLLRALGVGYLYSTKRFPAPGLSALALTGSGYYVYAVKNPLPRAYFAGRAHWLPHDQLHAKLRTVATRRPGAIRLGPEILIEGAAKTEGKPAYAPARVLTDRGSTVDVAVDAPRSGFLVLSDIELRGWSAAVDDRPAEIHKANGFARAVRVPAGAHTVQFTYTPAGLRTGAVVSAVTASLCLLALLGEGVRRRRSPRRPGSRTSRPRSEGAEGDRSSGP